MEVLKQFQKKNNNFLRVFFLFSLIFFCTLQISLAKVFSDFLEINGSFAQGGLLFGKTNSKSFTSVVSVKKPIAFLLIKNGFCSFLQLTNTSAIIIMLANVFFINIFIFSLVWLKYQIHFL